MKSLSQPPILVAWWVEVYTSAPPKTYCVGPFKSRAEAKISRGAQVEALYRSDARDIVALIKQR